MTDPLVPLHVDLRDFAFMPLDVLRLRDSDLATLSTGDQFKAAVLLWCAAWHQVPAGSIPNDDRWLARHSGSAGAWKRVKAEALRGFVECSDGRLYHEVISEKALESWRKKQEQRAKTLKARIAAFEKRIKESKTDGERMHLQAMLQGLLGDLSHMSVTGTVTSTNRSEGKGSKGKGCVEGALPLLSGLSPDDRTKNGAGYPKINGVEAKEKRTQAYIAEARELLAFLNERAGKRFPDSDTNVGIIVARLREGFAPLQVRQVIVMKNREWQTTDMRKYLRPDTLFNRSKFSNYVGELVDDPIPPDEVPA